MVFRVQTGQEGWRTGIRTYFGSGDTVESRSGCIPNAVRKGGTEPNRPLCSPNLTAGAFGVARVTTRQHRAELPIDRDAIR